MTTFGTIEQAIDDLRNGKIIIVADDEDRENEGDLVCAAELATPEMINFMTLHGRGLICAVQATSFLSAPGPAACSSGWARPKPVSISPGWPDSTQRASFVRSSTPT